MNFSEYIKHVNLVQSKIEQEKKQFEKNLLEKSKEEIILSYLELYIYSKLFFFFKYIEYKAKENQYILSIEYLKNINGLQNVMEYVKNQYFYGKTYEDRLTNEKLITYFKTI